jgi:hypothetical protein
MFLVLKVELFGINEFSSITLPSTFLKQ